MTAKRQMRLEVHESLCICEAPLAHYISAFEFVRLRLCVAGNTWSTEKQIPPMSGLTITAATPWTRTLARQSTSNSSQARKNIPSQCHGTLLMGTKDLIVCVSSRTSENDCSWRLLGLSAAPDIALPNECAAGGSTEPQRCHSMVIFRI